MASLISSPLHSWHWCSWNHVVFARDLTEASRRLSYTVADIAWGSLRWAFGLWRWTWRVLKGCFRVCRGARGMIVVSITSWGYKMLVWTYDLESFAGAWCGGGKGAALRDGGCSSRSCQTFCELRNYSRGHCWQNTFKIVCCNYFVRVILFLWPCKSISQAADWRFTIQA